MTDRLLRRAAERAGKRPFYLASVLLPFARSEGLDDPALADRLGCPRETLPALLLCRRPAPSSFRADVERLAAHFGLDLVRLAETIRLADALEAFAAPDTAHLLAAARDREPDPTPEPPTPPEGSAS